MIMTDYAILSKMKTLVSLLVIKFITTAEGTYNTVWSAQVG